MDLSSQFNLRVLASSNQGEIVGTSKLEAEISSSQVHEDHMWLMKIDEDLLEDHVSIGLNL